MQEDTRSRFGRCFWYLEANTVLLGWIGINLYWLRSRAVPLGVEELMLPESKTFELLGLNCKFIFALLGNKFKTSC